MTTQTLIVDIDDTICFPNHTQTKTSLKYGLAVPNEPMIKSLQVAKERGYKIVLHTARRMLTHNGDINKIIEDVGECTKNWLDRHNVPYDEIVWGKPYGVYYIDDKAMRPDEFIEWMDK
jgi:capsule biosynthesis phosphatase